jgi:hypothetical protein
MSIKPIYLNGKLLQRYGVVSSKKEAVKAMQPINEPISLEFKDVDQLLAIRFSVQEELPYLKKCISVCCFSIAYQPFSGSNKI